MSGGWLGLQIDIRGSRRQVSRAPKDQRHVDIPPYAHRAPPGEQPRDDGRHRADQPEPLQAVVDGAGTEDAPRANGAPDNAGGVKYLLAGARVLIWLVVRAVVKKKRHV